MKLKAAYDWDIFKEGDVLPNVPDSVQKELIEQGFAIEVKDDETKPAGKGRGATKPKRS